MHESKDFRKPLILPGGTGAGFSGDGFALMKIYTNLLKYIKIIYITLMRIYIAFISFILLLMYNENIIK